MKIRAIVLCVASIVLALASYVGREPAGSAPLAKAPAPLQEEAVQTAASAAELGRLISAFEIRVKQHADALDLTFLGKLYLQRARSTGDLGSYAQAQAALERAIAIAPDDAETRGALARLRYATHDFAGAARIAEAMLAADPTDSAAVAIRGDAELELGEYAIAAQAFDTLATLFPNAAAVDARLARLAFLRGDAQEARVLADRAGTSARAEGVFGIDLAWYAHLRAQLAFDRGDYTTAAADDADALAIAPGYYVAEAGLARATAALGRLDEAIALYERAIAAAPQPDYLAGLGDLYAARGDDAAARRMYAAVEVSATLSASNAGLYDRQFATFYLDHDRDIDRALTIAQAALVQRPDVYGYDIEAWALYKAGRLADARAASDRALSLGTADARLHYHAGLIALAQGDLQRAHAQLSMSLATSPAFDPLLAAHARAMLDRLQAVE